MFADLLVWKAIGPDESPEAFVFPNKAGGFLDPATAASGRFITRPSL
jgi:hypothetical protein